MAFEIGRLERRHVVDLQAFSTGMFVLEGVKVVANKLDAIRLMRSERVPILPVVKNEKLVGVVAESDFMPIASQLLEEKLGEDQ